MLGQLFRGSHLKTETMARTLAAGLHRHEWYLIDSTILVIGLSVKHHTIKVSYVRFITSN